MSGTKVGRPRERAAQLHRRADIAKRYAAAARQQLKRAVAKQNKRQAHAPTCRSVSRQASDTWTEEAPHALWAADDVS